MLFVLLHKVNTIVNAVCSVLQKVNAILLHKVNIILLHKVNAIVNAVCPVLQKVNAILLQSEHCCERRLFRVMADTTGITKQQTRIRYNVHLLSTPRPPYFGISRPRQNTYFAADHNRQNGKQTTNQSNKSKHQNI